MEGKAVLFKKFADLDAFDLVRLGGGSGGAGRAHALHQLVSLHSTSCLVLRTVLLHVRCTCLGAGRQ